MKAIVWDFDGTIVDTETAWFLSFREIYEQHGATLTLEDYSKAVGTQFDQWKHLESLVQRAVDHVALEELVQQRYAQYADEQVVLPGVLELLQAAKAQGMRIGLASSSHRPWVEGYLTKYGLTDFFECIFTREDVEHVKPHPALYLKAVEALGVSPEQAFAIEDSPNGTRAAKAAGLRCVVVPNELTRHFQFDEYDLRIDAREEFTLQMILQNLNNAKTSYGGLTPVK